MDALPPRDVWVHPGVAVGTSTIAGDGLFATEILPADTTVIRLGGRLVTSTELGELLDMGGADPSSPDVDTITVHEDRHLVLPTATMVHFGNHSCDPDLWLTGPYVIAARRTISTGEELTLDYGTVSGAPGFRMRCRCGRAACRGEVSGDDWRRPELQARYRDHWSPALLANISRS